LYTFELFIARRAADAQQQDEDPYGVRLLQAGRKLDEVLLSDSSCGQASVHPIESVRGGDAESKAWTTDAEHCESAVAARIVALSAQCSGLLLTQAKGYEYRYSSHYLYVANAERLRLVWTYDESFGGEERTGVRVLAGAAPGRQDVAFIHVLRVNDAAAEASAQRLRFDESTGEINASPLPDVDSPLYIVATGSYAKARDGLRLRSECLREFDLLKSAFFPAPGLPRFYFGRVFARRDDAEQLLASLAVCPELPTPRVIEYRALQGGGDGKHQ
jgi:hypothetical protein